MSLQRADVHQHLSHILAEESRLLTQLETLLQAETAIVGGDDVEAIARIGSSRQGCVDTLARLDTERADTCRMLSFGQGRAGMIKLFAWCDPERKLNAIWHTNLELARRCKKLNDANGAIVSAKLSRVEKLLMVLRGTSAPPVYSSRGSRSAALGSRDFGRA